MPDLPTPEPDSGRHRAEIRTWGNPANEQYVVLCHADGCNWRTPGGLGATEAGKAQMAHWRSASHINTKES